MHPGNSTLEFDVTLTGWTGDAGQITRFQNNVSLERFYYILFMKNFASIITEAHFIWKKLILDSIHL
jgi:hypothetical protein